MLSDGYVKYEEAEVYRPAIMQDFRDNEKIKLKWPTGGHFGFHNWEICHGLSLCETLHFVFFIHGPAILLFFSQVNITKLLKFKMATKRLFCNCLLPKVNQVIG